MSAGDPFKARIMAALTESNVMDSSVVDCNHKEAYSDCNNPSARSETAIAVNGSVNDENVCSNAEQPNQAAAPVSEIKKFIEAPPPKVNAWTINRSHHNTPGAQKPSRNQTGEVSSSCRVQ